MKCSLPVPSRRIALKALSAWAVGASTSASADAPAATLSVAAFPAVDQILKAALPQFQEKFPRVRVEVVGREFADHHTAMTTAIATGSKLPDVMALEAGFLGRFAISGALEDLSGPPYDALQYEKYFVPFTFQQNRDAQGNIVAMPTDIGIGALFYRQDLLARAGIAPASLGVSWESFVESGREIKKATGAYLVTHARDLKDIIIRSNLQPGEGIYFNGRKEVQVESARFVRAFELARRVRELRLDARVQAWSAEWAESFKRGTVATHMMGSWFAGHLANWLAPQTRGLWRTSALPDGAHAPWGGTFYAIPRRATHKSLAWELVRFMTLSPSLQLDAFKLHDAFPALLETHRDRYLEQPVAFLGGQAARALWRDLALQTPAIPLHKLDALADEIVNTELDKVLAGKKGTPQALADAARMLGQRIRHSA
jgi:multiple sugar transport system substrate-binding protein